MVVPPTVFADVESGMRLGQNEVFGPVLAVLRFRDEEHAARTANDTRYSLASGISDRHVEGVDVEKRMSGPS